MEQDKDKVIKAALEYNRRIRERAFTMPESLKDKTIMDVLISPEFETHLTALINEQVETRQQVLRTIAELKKKGKVVAENRPTIDRVIDTGLMDNAGDFAVEFARVLNKVSEYPRDIRDYIEQLGKKAYEKTICQLINDANPDMAELYKTATSTIKN